MFCLTIISGVPGSGKTTLARANRSLKGYEVFIDGVIGPWWFDQLREQLGPFRYVLLSCDLQESLARVTIRQGQDSATPDIVRRMHDQFLAV
ncbi:MAG: guanylate kinase [Patiriisocius sp.]